jgi:hypothetical protein
MHYIEWFGLSSEESFGFFFHQLGEGPKNPTIKLGGGGLQLES